CLWTRTVEHPRNRAVGVGLVGADRAGAHAVPQQPAGRGVDIVDAGDGGGNRLADGDAGPLGTSPGLTLPTTEPGGGGDLFEHGIALDDERCGACIVRPAVCLV